MYAVIMAGGSGTRFWPVSRRSRPKQFLNIIGQNSMIVETCDRLMPLVDDEETILVLGREHMREARGLFKDRNVHLIGEPVGRNTAPCIGLGAVYAQHLGCNSPLAFLPADHYIGNRAAFLKALRASGKIAEAGGLVTLGIVPSRPETGYGYIRRGLRKKQTDETEAYTVDAFVEKPELETAQQYLMSKEYYWNAGIFVAKPDTILTEMAIHLPELHEGLLRLKNALDQRGFDEVLESVYADLKGISFDYGVMEKTRSPVYVIPCECGWSDVGSWASLYELRAHNRDQDENLTEGDSLLIDCKKSFISAGSGRLVACVGLDNCLVVDTPDALLVTGLDHSQNIRQIIDLLKSKGKEDLL